MFWLFSPLTVGITDKAISRNTSCTRNHKAIYIYIISKSSILLKRNTENTDRLNINSQKLSFASAD